MNRCKDCKWWNERPNCCSNGVCFSPKCYFSKIDSTVTDACYTSGSFLVTGPEFGCVNFTPKDGES